MACVCRSGNFPVCVHAQSKWVHISVIHTLMFSLPHIHFPSAPPHEQGHSELTSGQIVQINTCCCRLCNHVCISLYWLWMYSICFEIGFWSSGGMGWNRPKWRFLFHVFVISYSAGIHGGAAKVQLDLATAECTLQCFSSYRMCLINMADHILCNLENLPLWCDHMCWSRRRKAGQ